MRPDAGLLLVDKPAGATSHDIMLRLRRALGVRRVGHTGTLDPFATGLLLALVGAFTRLADFFHALPKSYEATLELGRETDTDDLTGVTVSESPAWRDCDGERVRAAFAARVGKGRQVPSVYSARHVGGERAYDLARRGDRPALEAREVVFHELTVTEVDLPRVRFRARVSTGTYVRALARDIGRDLGAGAHLTALCRTGIGPFPLAEAVGPEEAANAVTAALPAWRPGPGALPWVVQRRLSGREEAGVRNGRPVERGDLLPPLWPDLTSAEPEAGPVALVAGDTLVAVAEARDDRLFPRKVFPA
ncbi:tRNA pseudouridine(55) synthase TruB [Candidatus Palauibacter sp.]|uniref:tRNA pseudouridine(55) synthase TruB n=1 Tax=Candidatus Palauibacter sp. TaxID=3101350 RepID=UPI003AF2B72B